MTGLSGLTTRGRCLFAAGVAAALCSLLLNERDLLRVAAFVIVLPILAALVAGRSRLGLSAQRRVPPRVPVGETTEVQLAVSSQGRMPAAALLLEDGLPYTLGQRPRFVVERMARHGTVLLSYHITPEIRGVHALGPLVARVTDPFGLAEFGRQLAGHTRLVVVPAVAPLTGLPAAAGRGAGDEGAGRLRLGQGEDDAVVRPFRQGDDLRKVHWRSTARRDELMVRVEEAPWRGGTTVLLDRRLSAHRGSGPTASLEWAVSLAASICLHLIHSGQRFRLVTEDGVLLAGGGNVDTSADLVLDALAAVQTSALDDLAHCRPLRDGQDVIAILGACTPEAAAELVSSRARATRSKAVLLDVDAWARGGEPAAPAPKPAARQLSEAGWTVVTATPKLPMDAVWAQLCGFRHTAPAAMSR